MKFRIIEWNNNNPPHWDEIQDTYDSEHCSFSKEYIKDILKDKNIVRIDWEADNLYRIFIKENHYLFNSTFNEIVKNK